MSRHTQQQCAFLVRGTGELRLPLISIGLIPALTFGAENENFTVIGSRVLGTQEQAHTAAVRLSRAGYGMPVKELEEAHGLV
jgi:hypothetical protein